jgi:MinD superfamily P-loop ATPase
MHGDEVSRMRCPDDTKRVTRTDNGYDYMRIAIASGKGGTGKTTTATNLAMTAANRGMTVRLLDCDVEEPNCHLFLNPSYDRESEVRVSAPLVDDDRCNACGACGRICQFSAIVALKTKPLTFPELCHSCGGCWNVCPTGAISRGERSVGLLKTATMGRIEFASGLLNIGEARAIPAIRAVKESYGPEGLRRDNEREPEELVFIDAPPGTSCPVIEAVRDSDAVILVTEPTPFGLHDFRLAAEMVKKIDLPAAAVINRAGIGDAGVNEFCTTEGIPILAEIPDDRRVAEAYSRGETAVEAVPDMRTLYDHLLERIMKFARTGA